MKNRFNIKELPNINLDIIEKHKKVLMNVVVEQDKCFLMGVDWVLSELESMGYLPPHISQNIERKVIWAREGDKSKSMIMKTFNGYSLEKIIADLSISLSIRDLEKDNYSIKLCEIMNNLVNHLYKTKKENN